MNFAFNQTKTTQLNQLSVSVFYQNSKASVTHLFVYCKKDNIILKWFTVDKENSFSIIVLLVNDVVIIESSFEVNFSADNFLSRRTVLGRMRES